MPVAEKTERRLTTATADPRPPQRGADGFPVRVWEVDGEEREFSLQPFAEHERPTYWYIGVGANLQVRAQTINEHGIQPVVLREKFTNGSYRPKNPWEEQVTREFLVRNHIDPDKSRDERHPKGEGHKWRCGDGFCNFATPSWHVFESHQRKLRHRNLRSES